MTESIHPGAVRPNYSLQQFAKMQLAEEGEWEQFLRVQNASPPKTNPEWRDGDLWHVPETPSDDFLLHKRLQTAFVERFRDEMRSGTWSVRAVSRGKADRESLASELAAAARDISFINGKIDSFTLVEIEPLSKEDRYLKLKWFIEQVCAVVPAKQGVSKAKVQELAERLLTFHVRDDLFKAAWEEAQKAPLWSKPGP